MVREVGRRSQRWDAERLGRLVRARGEGERVIVLANREPYSHDWRDGGITATRTASGVVTALEPIVRACHGVWVAHGSGSADRVVVDERDGVGIPGHAPEYRLRRVWLPPTVHQGYYEGFANEALWPLCHRTSVRPVFRAEDWAMYRLANEMFAAAVHEEAEGGAPTVFVQDYHFALAPRLIRERLPASPIVTFWHIPWPEPAVFETCPSHSAFMHGLLGSSVMGLQTPADCDRFLRSAARVPGVRVDFQREVVDHGGRETLVRAYPISIEYPSPFATGCPPATACRAEIASRLSLLPGTRLVVGVDRLDYTKGLVEKCLALERMFESQPEWIGQVVLAQIAEPSRGALPAYRDYRARVITEAARINARFGCGGYRPIVLLESHHEPCDVFRFLRAADVCLVSSLMDGMNLVAKEFVSARTDRRGVLLLSRHAGAAEQLREGALLIEPHDPHGTAQQLARALTMPSAEQEGRLAGMQSVVASTGAYWWAAQLLRDARRFGKPSASERELSRVVDEPPAQAHDRADRIHSRKELPHVQAVESGIC